MADTLFMFLAEGVSAGSASRRAGARHALMLYAKAGDAPAARSAALACADEFGWLHVDIKSELPLMADAREVENESLRVAACHARDRGSAIVVFSDEIPLDS